MNSLQIFRVFLMISLVASLISGCKKDEKEELEEAVESIQSAEDNAMVETEFSALFDFAGDVAEMGGAAKSSPSMTEVEYTVLPSGALVVFTDSLWNDGDGLEFYIDFGELGNTPPRGLLCKDGRYRAGRVDATLSDHFYNTGSVLTITVPLANNYYVGDGTNMAHVSGTKTVTRTDDSTFHVVVTGAQATGQSGTILWSADRYTSRTYDAGPGIWGDEFTFWGTAEGTNINGVGFTATVIESDPLIKKLQLGCATTFVAGVVTIQNNNGGTLILDYDPYNDQACDKVAQVTVNGVSRIFMVR
ncbi:MAG: hypothetical protein JW861_08880 [Bacteroidales bacterium]|nr:hypothetical protein [Bacteroidales bacterium]